MSLENEIEFVAEEFISRNMYGVCLLASTVFIKRYGSGEIIQGYLKFLKNGAYVRHYWVRVDGYDVDIGSKVSRVVLSEDIWGDLELSTEEPSGFVEDQDISERMFLEYGYQLYCTDQADFWRKVQVVRPWILELVN